MSITCGGRHEKVGDKQIKTTRTIMSNALEREALDNGNVEDCQGNVTLSKAFL